MFSTPVEFTGCRDERWNGRGEDEVLAEGDLVYQE